MATQFDNDIQNPIVDEIRRRYLEELNVDTSDLSNEALLFRYAQGLEKKGYTQSSMRDLHGDEFTDQYYDIKNRPDPNQGYLGEIGSGFKESLYGLSAMPLQAAGLAAGAVGDAVGVDLGVEDYLMEKANEIASKGQDDPRTIQSFDDIRWDNPSEVARYLLGGVGYAVPSVAESALAFTGAGAVGYGIAKQSAKKALRKSIENRLGETADEKIKDVFQEVVKAKARQGFATGSMVGLGTSSIGLGVGEIYGELYPNTQLDPTHPDYISPETARGVSTAFGTLAGSLDMMGAGKLLSRLTGSTEGKAKSYLKRLLMGLPEGLVIEGGTESVQELINIAAEKYAKGEEIEFSDQEILRMVDAGILGAIGGVGFSAIGAIPGPKDPPTPEARSEEIASETPEVQAQKELLEEIQDAPTVDLNRYEVGDEVQTAYGEKGTIMEARKDVSVVEMKDGSIREIRNDRLAAALDPIEPEVTEPTPAEGKEEVPKAQAEEIVSEEQVPEHKDPTPEEVSVDVEFGENKVTVTEQTKSDLDKLFKYYGKWKRSGEMYKSRGRANRAKKGWGSNDWARMELMLGPDKAIIRGKRGDKNKAALRALGFLDPNGEISTPTKADEQFQKAELKRLKEDRLARIKRIKNSDDNYLAPGKRVKDLYGELGEVQEVNKDGFVVVDGELYDPKHLYKVKVKPVSTPKTTTPKDPNNPKDDTPLNPIPRGFDFKDKKVTLHYKQNDGRKKKVAVGAFADEATLKEQLVTFLSKRLKNPNTAIRNIGAIEIGDETFIAERDAERELFNFGGIQITFEEIKQAGIVSKPPRKSDKGATPQTIQLPDHVVINTVQVGGKTEGAVQEEYNPSVFDSFGETPGQIFLEQVDYDDLISDGELHRSNKSASVGIDQRSRTKALLIFKKDNEIRITSAYIKNKIVLVYDATRGGSASSRYIRLDKLKEEQGWELTGKVNSTGNTGGVGRDVDVFYTSLEAFESDPKIAEAAVRAQDEQTQTVSDIETQSKVAEKDRELEDLQAQLDASTASLEDLQAMLKELDEESDDQGMALEGGETKEQVRARIKAQIEQTIALRKEIQKKIEEKKRAIEADRAELKNKKISDARTGTVRQGVDGAEDGKDGFTATNEQSKALAEGAGSAKGAKKNFDALTIPQFFGLLEQTKLGEMFLDTFRDMVGGPVGGIKEGLLSLYVGMPSSFDSFLQEFYTRLVNDKAIKPYATRKDGMLDPIDRPIDVPAKLNSMRGLIKRIIKARGPQLTEAIESFEYERQERGSEKAVRSGDLQPAPEPKPQEPVQEEEVEKPKSRKQLAREKLRGILKDYDRSLNTDSWNRLNDFGQSPVVNRDTFKQDAIEEILDIFDPPSQRDFVMDIGGAFSEEELLDLFDSPGRIRVADTTDAQGLQLKEGYEADKPDVDHARLNPNSSTVTIIDPTTNRREIRQTATTSEEAIDHSYEEARRDPRRYLAPKQNPVAEENPNSVEEAQAAFKRFAPMEGLPFTAQTAINQIITRTNVPFIGNVARMLNGNKLLDNYTIEFAKWEDYRPYARVNGILTRAVHIPSKKKIIISDAFLQDNELHKADDILAGTIVHELLHPVLNPILDFGEAIYKGNTEFIADENILQHKQLAGDLWTNMTETMLPYLREQASGDLKLSYGLTSVDEFFSVFASDPYFRDFLSKTSLPKSMRRKGVLNTVLDFIYRILAKLNFATVTNDNALSYATDQLNQLVNAVQPLEYAIDVDGNRVGIPKENIQASALDPQFQDLDRFYYGEKQKYSTVLGLKQERDIIKMDFPVSVFGEDMNIRDLEKRLEDAIAKEDFTGGKYSADSLQFYLNNANEKIKKRMDKYVKEEGIDLKEVGLQGTNLSTVDFDPKLKELEFKDIQASALDPQFQEGLRSEGPYFQREVLNDISKRSKPGTTEYNIIQAINVLRGGQGDGSPIIQSKATTTPEIDTERKGKVKELARGNSQLIDESEINEELDWGQVFSGEHDVYFDENRQEYVKAYRGDTELSEYLERLLLHNEFFPEVKLNLDGFVEREASDSGKRMLMPVVSQKALKADSKAGTPLGLINTEMLKKGFRNQGIQGISEGEPYNTYLRGNIQVRDLTSRNAIIQNGEVFLFDPFIDQGWSQSLNDLESEIAIIGQILAGDVRYDRHPEATKYKERFNLRNTEDLANQLESLQAEADYLNSRDIQASALDSQYQEQFQDGLENANPDENMRVMMEANAAGFNDLVTELVKVYQQVAKDVGIELEDFMDLYGSPGTSNISTIKKRLDRDLKPFMDSSDGVRLDDAGLNRIAFNWGRRKAVANLEAVRAKARTELQERVIAEDLASKAITDSLHLYEDLLARRFPPAEKQVESILSKANAVSFDTLKEYVTSLPNADLTQSDIRTIQEISKREVESVMEQLIDLPGVAETQKKGELLDSIKAMGIPTIKALAIMRAVRESTGQMALFRLSKGRIGESQQAMMDVAHQIAKATDQKQLDKIIIKSGVEGTPLRYFARLKAGEIIERANLEKLKKEQEIYNKIDLSLKVRSDRLRASLGELMPVSIHDGAELLTMRWDDKSGEWVRGKNFKVQYRNGKIVDRANFVKVNKETLRFTRDPEMQKLYREEPWFDLMREQALMALHEPIADEFFHVQRASWLSGLQGLTERFSKLGYEGMKLSQMSSETVALFRDYSSKSQSLALQFNASAQQVMGALKLGGREFYSGLYQDIWWWFDNHPEYAGNEEEAFSQLWSNLRKYANVPDRTLLDTNARKLVKNMIAKALAARDFEKKINMELGNRIKDDEFKVQSYIDGEMVDFYRRPIDIGYATMPRSINDGLVIDTNELMQSVGWRGEAASELLNEAGSVKDLETMEKIYKRIFPEKIVGRFVKPFLHSDVRQSVFRGPADSDGHNAYMGNSFVREAYRQSGGDIFKMTDIIFDRVSESQTLESRLQWKAYFLRQMDGKYMELKKVADRLLRDRVHQGLKDSHLMRNTPQSLDARMMESRLPKEFFYYTMYDEVTSSIRLALQVATKTFGRNGDKAGSAFTEGRDSFEKARGKFNRIMAQATNGKHDSPQRSYTREEKKEAYRILRREGEPNAEKAWNQLYAKAVALGELNKAMEHLARYYGKDNAAGPYKDANLLLELLGVQALSVLNNPKSSFWQNLGLFEFPMAFRGLNKMAGKGTVTALGNFVNQTFGGIAEAMGMEMEKTGRYAQYLNNTHFRLDEMDLSFKEYVTGQLGSGGDMDGPNAKKYLRMVKRAMMFNKRKNVDGTRAPFDFLTAVKGIFPYINNVVNHSIGVGAIHSYNDLVLQVTEEIERRGITEYDGEFTAEDLGMGDKTGEWIIGEADGYRRMNELLISHGLPSVTRLAFDFIDRKKADKNAFPIEQRTAILINTIAMDQISGDGFNAKPAWLYSNDYLRYFNTFLGWPLGKMGRDLTAVIRDSDDPTTTYIALLKYIGLLSAVYMPLSLSFGMMIDWYDDEMLEKPNNLPPITPWAALPIVGIPIAASDPNFTIYSVTSRLAKAGVPFGMGTELINGIFSKGDPYGASRELSLDTRIFAFSMIKNIYDAFGTWIHQGEWDWETVGRPIAYGVGGNSVIQMMDLATAQLDIDSEERRVADYIGLKNTIKKTAFMMGLELRPPYKGGGRPTGVSVNTRQMARAAYAGDSQGFLEQYQQAMEAAKVDGREDPERSVIESYKRRSLKTGVTKTKLSEREWEMILSALSEEDRMRVQQAEASHEHYLNLIGGGYRKPSMRSQMRQEDARLLALQMMMQ